MSAGRVEKVRRLTFERFSADFLGASVPVVVTGMLEAWPARRRWSFEHLRAVLGERTVQPVVLAAGRFHIGDEGVRVESMSFSQYLEALSAADAPPYYLRHPLTGADEALEADFQTPDYCRHRLMLKRNLWVGAPGTASDLHFDMTHNLVAQVLGRRKVVLFAPDQTEQLYPYPRHTLNWHHSQVRLEAVDLARFPRFAQAHALETDLEGGELLFIPQGYWHRLETLVPSIAVNFFWLTKRHVPAMALAKLLWTVRGVKT